MALICVIVTCYPNLAIQPFDRERALVSSAISIIGTTSGHLVNRPMNDKQCTYFNILVNHLLNLVLLIQQTLPSS